MSRRIVFAPSFDAEFLAISWYIERQFGAGAADEFEARVRNASMLLAEWPET